MCQDCRLALLEVPQPCIPILTAIRDARVATYHEHFVHVAFADDLLLHDAVRLTVDDRQGPAWGSQCYDVLLTAGIQIACSSDGQLHGLYRRGPVEMDQGDSVDRLRGKRMIVNEADGSRPVNLV